MAAKRRFPDRENAYLGHDNKEMLRNGDMYANSGENPGPQTNPPNPPGTITAPHPVPNNGRQRVHTVRKRSKKLSQKGIVIESPKVHLNNVGLRVAKKQNPLDRKYTHNVLAAQLRESVGKQGDYLQIGDLRIETPQAPIDRKKGKNKNKKQHLRIRKMGKV